MPERSVASSFLHRPWPLRLAALLLLATSLAATTARAYEPLPAESGRLQDFIAKLASRKYLLREPKDDPRPYVEPGSDVITIRRIAHEMDRGDMAKAARQARRVDCEVIKFTDRSTRRVYYALREDLAKLDAPRGWGSYILRPKAKVAALVEVPHPLADVNTVEIGAEVFAKSDARGFLMAGAHREKADVPDMVDSPFHQVHMAWSGPFAQVTAWQIHGFESAKHGFPHGANVVASNGDGAIVPEITNLDAMLEDRGLVSYVFNDLAPESRANKQLNGGTPGVMFTALAATKNEQGRYSRRLGGSFVHVELDTSVRLDAANRELAVAVIADAMRRDPEHDDEALKLASYAPEEATPETLATKEKPAAVAAAVEVEGESQETSIRSAADRRDPDDRTAARQASLKAPR